MWPVTKDNADFVIVMSASAIAYAVGALTSHIWTKNYMTAKYEDIVEVEVNQAKVFYSQRNKTGEYADPVKLVERLSAKDEDEDEVVEYEEKVQPYSTDAIEFVEEEPTPLKPRPKPKKVVSQPEPDEDMEAFEQRLIDEAKDEVQEVKDRLGVFDEEDVVDEERVSVNVFKSQDAGDLDKSGRKSNRPYIISFQEFNDGELDYIQNTLTYFDGDGVLVDDRENPINHMNKIIGETNLDFGNSSQDDNVVYIRNDEMEVDFEVCRSAGKFTEEVLGMPKSSSKSRVKKFRTYD